MVKISPTKEINLDHITKIEGHAKLYIRIEDNKVKTCELKTFEGARYFEGLLLGKKYLENSYITSRICGICSVAHTITSLKAVENAFGVKTSKQVDLLRELLMIGGHIQSHALHLYFMALPDYFGVGSALGLAKTHKDIVLRALRIKKLGNKIVNVLGGRDIHPISCTVGGFLKLPTQAQLNELANEFKAAKKDVEATVELFSSLKYPKFNHNTKYFALDNLNLNKGEIYDQNLKKSHDLKRRVTEFFENVSTAEYVELHHEPYMVGALARCNQSYKLLQKKYRKFFPSQNPYHNNLAQAIELTYNIDKGIDILSNLKIKNEPLPKVVPKASTGVGISEAPRGLLFHEYSFNKQGICIEANITTPTSQNLRQLEQDIRNFLPAILKLPEDKIKLEIEQLIRAYDPCISCATHFLELRIDRA